MNQKANIGIGSRKSGEEIPSTEKEGEKGKLDWDEDTLQAYGACVHVCIVHRSGQGWRQGK